MAKKVKKLEDVKPEDTTEAIEEVIETPVEEVADEVATEPVEEPTEAETLPKVEFNEEVAPKGYSSLITPKDKKDELKMKNGRIYKEIGNGFGMFLDNGSVFKL